MRIVVVVVGIVEIRIEICVTASPTLHFFFFERCLCLFV